MKQVLAIDFGTCNTYASVTTMGGRAIPYNYSAGGNNTKGIDSACLQFTRGSRAGQVFIGEKALKCYGGASDEDIQSAGLSLATNFKPDIERSAKAREDSTTFLKEVLKLYKTNDSSLDPTQMEVIFGVPSEASDSYRNCLKQIARQAGFGSVRLLPEPFGALSSYQNELSDEAVSAMVNDNTLVVDFGGGTCDFAILQGGEIRHSWGDMLLGGRLFDDLFYQWILEQVQKTDKKMTQQYTIDQNMDYYLRTVKCRILKEEFSDSMVANRTTTFTPYFNNRYALSLTWEEFMKRAANYKPSLSFQKRTPMPSDLTHTRFSFTSTIDIISWFRDELKRGFAEKNIPFNSIQKVLLAGGSSKWAFSRDICKELLPQSQIVDCENVFAAISMGLAKYVVIKHGSEDKVNKLKESQSKCVENIVSMIQETLEDESKIKSLGEELFNEFALPKFEAYQKNGGKVVDIETSIANDLKNSTFRIKEILQPLFERSGKGFDLLIRDELKAWFNKCGVSSKEYVAGNVKLDVSSFISQNPEFWSGTTIAQALSSAVADALLTYITMGDWGKNIATSLFGKSTLESLVKNNDLSWFRSALNSTKIQEIKTKCFLPKFVEKFLSLAQGFINKNKNEISKQVLNATNKELENYMKVIVMDSDL